MSDDSPFRRMVLSLQASAPDRMIAFAGEFAKALHLDLLGMFSDDPNLRLLAELPLAREFRMLEGGWRAPEPGQIVQDIEMSMRAMQRTFELVARQLSLAGEFSVARGAPAETLEAVARAGDIVVIAEPPHPADRASRQFTRLIAAAHRSCASVLLMPRRLERREGPVAVIAAGTDLPCVRAAEAFARALHSQLRVVAPPKNAAELGEPRALERLLGPPRERLVVADRRFIRDIDTIAMAESRRVPVLIVES